MSVARPPYRRYFFFDIDGTLTPGGPHAELLPSAKLALRQLRQRGNFVAVATGRLQVDALRICRELEVWDMVSDGGNAITLGGELVQMDPLPQREALGLLEEAQALGFLWAATVDNAPVRVTPYPQFAALAGDSYFETTVLPGLDPARLPRFYKLYILCPPQREGELKKLSGLPTVRYGSRCLFVEPTHKEAGIRRMLELLGAAEPQVAVFGDGTNDLSMFQPQWTCIAMGNACPQLKERADFVTLPAGEDGVYHACKQFGWID